MLPFTVLFLYRRTDSASVLGCGILASGALTRLTQDVVILQQDVILLTPADFKYQFADIQKILPAHF